jgi:hypothetical protein
MLDPLLIWSNAVGTAVLHEWTLCWNMPLCGINVVSACVSRCAATPAGRGLGPRLIMGLAWSGYDQNLALQARVVLTWLVTSAVQCTRGRHCNDSSIIRPGTRPPIH